MPQTKIDRHGVMERVVRCGYFDCGYTTNIRGDITKHYKEKHRHTGPRRGPTEREIEQNEGTAGFDGDSFCY